jgi:hypothetical protein
MQRAAPGVWLYPECSTAPTPHVGAWYTSASRQSRLHLNLIIKNGERVSLRGAFGAPRIYRVVRLRELLANCLQRSDNGGHRVVVSIRSLLARDSFFLRVIIGSGAIPPPLSPARNPTSPPN